MTAISRARLRRAVRKESLGVDVRGALGVVGLLIGYLSLTLAFPLVIALLHRESVVPFVATAAVGAACGFGLAYVTRAKTQTVGTREAFLIVSLTWVFAAALGALPYVFSTEPQLDSPVDAYFEAMSGFTTTGASVLTDLPEFPRSLLMWRQFTQFLGGMGIIVLALAVLPRLRVGGRQLLAHEAPGPEIEPLTASIRDTARRLWLLYVALTLLLGVILTIFGWTDVDPKMNLYEGFAHAFTTLPTGGFGTQPDSYASFAAETQWVVILFMALAGANFALLYRAFIRRQGSALLRDEELRLYVVLLAVASIAIFAQLVNGGLHRGEEAVRHAAFQTVSIMTTTGGATVDFNEWLGPATLAAVVLIGLMFFGGSAGSTSGSVKVVRHLLIGRSLSRELDQTVHPELVRPIHLNRAPVDERTLRAVITFVLLYVGIFALGALLLVIDSARAGLEVSPFTAIAAAATTIGNVGPAFGFAGPFGSFQPWSDFSKGLMIVLMWLGRLEIIPVVVLFTKAYWRA